MITTSPTSEKQNKTILIVDDSEDMRALLTQALTLENYHVLAAGNGKEAFELLDKATCPDLILLDLSMPEMDGEDFIKKFHQYPGCNEAKVIILSGWEGLDEKAKRMHADGYLRKPIDLQDLYQEIPRHLNSSRKH